MERFLAKCRFEPETGCVVWTGGMTSANAGRKRMGVFWFEGKRWPARRWAAKHIHGLPIEDREAVTTCGEDLCVRHVRTMYPVVNTRQHWLLASLGYDGDPDDPDRLEAERREKEFLKASIPAEDRAMPEWLGAAEDEVPF